MAAPCSRLADRIKTLETLPDYGSLYLVRSGLSHGAQGWPHARLSCLDQRICAFHYVGTATERRYGNSVALPVISCRCTGGDFRQGGSEATLTSPLLVRQP